MLFRLNSFVTLTVGGQRPRHRPTRAVYQVNMYHIVNVLDIQVDVLTNCTEKKLLGNRTRGLASIQSSPTNIRRFSCYPVHSFSDFFSVT